VPGHHNAVLQAEVLTCQLRLTSLPCNLALCALRVTLPCVPQWDALDEAEKAKYPFQRDLKRRMDSIIADCMKKIDRNKERLAAADTPLVTPADQVRPHPRFTFPVEN